MGNIETKSPKKGIRQQRRKIPLPKQSTNITDYSPYEIMALKKDCTLKDVKKNINN